MDLITILNGLHMLIKGLGVLLPVVRCAVQQKDREFRRRLGAVIKQQADLLRLGPVHICWQSSGVQQAVVDRARQGCGGVFQRLRRGGRGGAGCFKGGFVFGCVLVRQQQADRITAALPLKKDGADDFPLGERLPAAAGKQQRGQQRHYEQRRIFRHSHAAAPPIQARMTKPQVNALRQRRAASTSSPRSSRQAVGMSSR